MKKIFSLFTVLCMTGVLLSSCVSLTKRHYTKGYHVTRHTSIPERSSNTDEVKSTETKNYSTVAPVTVPTTFLHSDSVSGPKSPPVVMPAEVSRPTSRVTTEPAEKNSPKNQIRALANPMKTLKQVLSNKRISIAHDGEGHSLLWIIIVVILILWLIGFLADGFGLGGLIHLLLVIALILFILWLLRVL